MEKRKCKSYFGDYKCHVKTNIKDSKGNFVYVDKCLKEAIENLNAVGLKTVASCCGHGIINPKITIEGLSDGMEVDLKKSKCNKHIVSKNEDELINFLDDLYSERDNYSSAKLIELIKEKLINESEVSVCECRPEWMLEVRPNLVKCSKCGTEY